MGRVAAALAALLASVPGIASAAVISLDLDIAVSGGILAGERLTGTVQYDEAKIDGLCDCLQPGLPGFNGIDVLTISFLGQTFTENDDVGFPDDEATVDLSVNPAFPILRFTGTTLTQIDFIVSEVANIFGDNLTEILDPRIDGFALLDVMVENGTVFGQTESISYTGVETEVIPLPAGLPLLLGGLGILGWMKRRKNAAA